MQDVLSGVSKNGMDVLSYIQKQVVNKLYMQDYRVKFRMEQTSL